MYLTEGVVDGVHRLGILDDDGAWLALRREPAEHLREAGAEPTRRPSEVARRPEHQEARPGFP